MLTPRPGAVWHCLPSIIVRPGFVPREPAVGAARQQPARHPDVDAGHPEAAGTEVQPVCALPRAEGGVDQEHPRVPFHPVRSRAPHMDLCLFLPAHFTCSECHHHASWSHGTCVDGLALCSFMDGMELLVERRSLADAAWGLASGTDKVGLSPGIAKGVVGFRVGFVCLGFKFRVLGCC